MAKARKLIQQIWESFREVLGDRAYERYAACLRARGEQPLAPKDFYISHHERKYTRPSRCC